MSAFAIVPVQRLVNAKSRLSTILSPGERRQLVIRSLDNVLRALNDAEAVRTSIVVSPDEDVLRRSAAMGAIPVEQLGRGLNEAIRLGRDLAISSGAETLLVVLADLPFLTATEVDRLLDASALSPVTMAPDRHGHGTNALVLRPPDAIAPAFGVDSFHTHSHEAQRLGLSIGIVESNGTGFDVDTVDDLIDLGWIGQTSRPGEIGASLRPYAAASAKYRPSQDLSQ